MSEARGPALRCRRSCRCAKVIFQFEWHDGPRTLELEVEDPWTIHYLKWHSEAGIEEEEVCSITDAGTVIGLIEWFAKG